VRSVPFFNQTSICYTVCMEIPTAGQQAPDFSLPDQDGVTHSLSSYIGKWVLLYFYPKDNTPGCTIEACTIRDQFKDFQKIGAAVLGVSTDSVKSHKRFADGFNLPFTLLADEQKEVVGKYGVFGEKKFMGKTYMGIGRTSFLIDPSGKIAKVYEKVKPEKHAAEVLADLAGFAAV
jgi:peroxiredoxin Q/BCP